MKKNAIICFETSWVGEATQVQGRINDELVNRGLNQFYWAQTGSPARFVEVIKIDVSHKTTLDETALILTAISSVILPK